MVQQIKTCYAGAPDMGGSVSVIRTDFGALQWTPLQLASLKGWYDASVAASLSLTGSSVNSMADQSGNGNNVANLGGTKPLYEATGLNSRPTINFSNANNGDLTKTSLSFGTGNTLTAFFVGSYSAQFSQSYARAMSYFAGSGGQTDVNNNSSFILSQEGTTSTVVLYRNASIAHRQFYSTANTPARCIATIDSSGVMTIYVDGVATTGNTLNAAFGNNGTLRIGQCDPNTGNSEWHGRISEIGIASGFSDATTVGLLDTYLKNKWGL